MVNPEHLEILKQGGALDHNFHDTLTASTSLLASISKSANEFAACHKKRVRNTLLVNQRTCFNRFPIPATEFIRLLKAR
jgi:hypothetical protein